MITKNPNKQLPKSNISWSDVYFTAEANREPFEDVSVITLKSHFADIVYDLAIDEVGVEDSTKLMACVRKIITDNTIHVYEHVKVSKDGICVVIDCERVNEDAVWKALDMLAFALDCLEGQVGTVCLGQQTTFKVADIPWLNHH